MAVLIHHRLRWRYCTSECRMEDLAVDAVRGVHKYSVCLLYVSGDNREESGGD
jgi:hypothetical protein